MAEQKQYERTVQPGPVERAQTEPFQKTRDLLDAQKKNEQEIIKQTQEQISNPTPPPAETPGDDEPALNSGKKSANTVKAAPKDPNAPKKPRAQKGKKEEVKEEDPATPPDSKAEETKEGETGDQTTPVSE